MSCNQPTRAFQRDEPNPAGKRPVMFNPAKGYMTPVQLPCGKCEGCRADQSLAWAIRCYHETQEHDHNCFATLTYDNEHLPLDGKLLQRDMQNFIKRLRKRIAPDRLRYFYCGEYGEQTRRPHYHMLIWGLDFLHDAVQIGEYYQSPTLTETWGNGNVIIAPLELGSIMYTCGYVNKKIGDPDTYSRMSRRPGIGATWLKKYMDDLHATGTVTMGGREFPIPSRYFLATGDEFSEIKESRREYAATRNELSAQALKNRAYNLRSKNKRKQEKN